jgi:hypothetical protein
MKAQPHMLEEAATHRHGPYAHQVDDPLRKPAYLIGLVEALLLNGGAGVSVAREHSPTVLQLAASVFSLDPMNAFSHRSQPRQVRCAIGARVEGRVARMSFGLPVYDSATWLRALPRH